MTEFEVYVVTKNRLETVWREAERRARLLAALSDMREDADTCTSRATGGRA